MCTRSLLGGTTHGNLLPSGQGGHGPATQVGTGYSVVAPPSQKDDKENFFLGATHSPRDALPGLCFSMAAVSPSHCPGAAALLLAFSASTLAKVFSGLASAFCR